jgi:hypothetical protein
MQTSHSFRVFWGAWLLGLLFIALKLAGLLALPWLWALSPLWFIYGVYGLVLFVAVALDRLERVRS